MTRLSPHERRRIEQFPRGELARHQLARLKDLLTAILPQNRFYSEKLAQVDLALQSLADLDRLPFTFKDELVTAAHGSELAANLTFPLPQYVRYHQTSGTHGRPMAVLDTTEDWQWWIDCWQFVLDAA